MEKKLPVQFENRKISLLPYLEFGWDRSTFLEFLSLSSDEQFCILGGDVYKKDNTGYVMTYENWYLSKREVNEPFVAYCIRSKIKAKEFLDHYPKNQDVLFAPVITTAVTAGL